MESLEAQFHEAGIAALPARAYEQFHTFLDLLLRWNQRLNLTAIREPAEIVRRHFIESAFAAQRLPAEVTTLLDFGSGAGFPGIPIAICRPEIKVTLAESQGKKAAFLREAVRSLGLSAGVYGGRVEEMPEQAQFDAVTMRAVERFESSLPVALERVRQYLVLLTTEELAGIARELSPRLRGWQLIPLPNASRTVLAMAQR